MNPEPDTYETLAMMIEYPLLAPELADDDIAEGCRMAREHRVGCVVVRPSDVDQALRYMEGSDVPVGSTVGYPDGASLTGTKLYEGRDLLRRGAKELEIVINVGKMISRQFQYVEMELLQMAKSCMESGAVLKVNMRTDLLADDLKIIGSKICKRIEAQMITVANTPQDIALIKPLLKDVVGLKVSGPIHTLPEAMGAKTAGAQRFDAVDVPLILAGWKAHLEALQVAAATGSQSGPSST